MKNHNKICLTYNNFDKLLNLALQNCQTKPNFQPNILIETSTPSCTFLSNSLNTITIYDYSKNNSSSSNQLYDTNNCYVNPLSNIFTNKYLTPFSDIKTQLQNIPSSSLIIILLGNLSMSTSPPDQNQKIDPSQFSVSTLKITTINGYNTKVIPTTNIPFDLYVYNNDTRGIQTYKNLIRKQNKGYYFQTSFDESDQNQNYIRISNSTFPEILVIGPELNYNCKNGRCLMGGICHYNFQPPDCQKCANNHTYHFENPIPGTTICPKPGESGTCTVAPPCSKCIGNWTNTRCDVCPVYRFDNDNGNCDTCMFGWTSTPKPGEITPIPTCDYCPPNYDNSDGTCSNCASGWSGDNCKTKIETCTPKCTDNTGQTIINCGQDDGCGGTCPNTKINVLNSLWKPNFYNLNYRVSKLNQVPLGITISAYAYNQDVIDGLSTFEAYYNYDDTNNTITLSGYTANQPVFNKVGLNIGDVWIFDKNTNSYINNNNKNLTIKLASC